MGLSMGENVPGKGGRECAEKNVMANCPGEDRKKMSGSACKITSLYVQRLRFVTPCLTNTHTHQQLLIAYTISSASLA